MATGKWLTTKRALLLSGLLCILTFAGAQDANVITTAQIQTIANGQENTPKKQPPTVAGKQPENFVITSVYSTKQSSGKFQRIASINDYIFVTVSNGDRFRKLSLCKDSSGADLPAGTCRPQEVRLFIDGRRMEGISPVDGAPQIDPQSGNAIYQFKLERNAKNDKTWADILGAPPIFNSLAFEKPVHISVGFENGYALAPLDIKADELGIIRIHKTRFYVCLVGVLILIAAIIFFAKNRGLLRDRVIDLRFTEIQNPAPGSNGIFQAPPLNPPFSLGRFQMAFWFTLVVASFCFIWIITEAHDILTASTLALIGISAGTSLSALVIDDGKTSALIEETKAMQLKHNDPLTTPLEKQQLLDKINGNIKQLHAQPSKGFFTDVLQDANGISFHRLQMLAWTFILGLLFVYTVWKRLSMPEFDPILLALQGLTAGTYLGFKFPEKQR